MEERDKQFAVAWINFYDNELTIDFVWAKDWREAVMSCATSQFIALEEIPEDIEEAKRIAFDRDSTFEVREV
jgi:hypothetical protein